MPPRRAAAVAVLLLASLAAGCGHAVPVASPRSHQVATPAAATPAPATPAPGGSGPGGPSAAPARTTSSASPAAQAAGLPAFHAAVSAPLVAAQLPYSWRPGCPVPPRQLRELHATFLGFDGRAHTGTLVVNAAVVRAVVSALARLYAARFPIRRMRPVDAYRGSDPASMAADNTSAFNCRPAVTSGPPSWSMHAYGEAIDVNPVENPYLEGGRVQPPEGAAYVDRSALRPGMAYPGGVLVSAFAAVGWGWGGAWSGTPDYQHFSVNGH